MLFFANYCVTYPPCALSKSFYTPPPRHYKTNTPVGLTLTFLAFSFIQWISHFHPNSWSTTHTHMLSTPNNFLTLSPYFPNLPLHQQFIITRKFSHIFFTSSFDSTIFRFLPYLLHYLPLADHLKLKQNHHGIRHYPTYTPQQFTACTALNVSPRISLSIPRVLCMCTSTCAGTKVFLTLISLSAQKSTILSLFSFSPSTLNSHVTPPSLYYLSTDSSQHWPPHCTHLHLYLSTTHSKISFEITLLSLQGSCTTTTQFHPSKLVLPKLFLHLHTQTLLLPCKYCN